MPKTTTTNQQHTIRPEPGDNPKKQDSVDVDDAQLNDVTDDSAFSDPDGIDESEITDENQRSESRVEPRRKLNK